MLENLATDVKSTRIGKEYISPNKQQKLPAWGSPARFCANAIREAFPSFICWRTPGGPWHGLLGPQRSSALPFGRLRDRSAREGFAGSAITSFRDSRKSRTRTKSCNSGTNHLADAVSNRKKCEAAARVGCRSNSGTVADIDREGIPVQHIAPAKSERLAPAKSERPALAGVQLPSMGRKTPPQRPPRSSLPDLARCAPKPSVFSRHICAV